MGFFTPLVGYVRSSKKNAPNTKKGGTQFKNMGGFFGPLSGVVKKRFSTVRKKRGGIASKIVKKK